MKHGSGWKLNKTDTRLVRNSARPPLPAERSQYHSSRLRRNTLALVFLVTPRNFPRTLSVSSIANRLKRPSSIHPEGVKVMKTQAWGWLTAAVLAAGLNSSYQNGGMQWAHEIVDRVQHNTGAVLALATGRADHFLTEARMVSVDRQKSKCPFAAAMAEAQRSFDRSQSEFDQVQALSDREQEQLARLEAKRARIEAEVQSRLARIQFADNGFTFTNSTFANQDFSFTNDGANPVVVQVPRIHCPHVRVNTQRIPRVRVRIPRIDIPAPVVEVSNSSAGPI